MLILSWLNPLLNKRAQKLRSRNKFVVTSVVSIKSNHLKEALPAVLDSLGQYIPIRELNQLLNWLYMMLFCLSVFNKQVISHEHNLGSAILKAIRKISGNGQSVSQSINQSINQSIKVLFVSFFNSIAVNTKRNLYSR